MPRADRLLVERGLFESRAKAQAAIAAGLVSAGGVVVRKPSEELAADAVLAVARPHPWVSRGGVKLSAALDHFGFDPKDRVCLDVGASTGGFTQVLLARGARRVIAVDVGHGQLHALLRKDPRVVSFEGTDIRNLDRALLPETPDFATVDVSFISLKLVLPRVLALLERPGHVVALVKPQFELGPQRRKRGVVRDPHLQARACEEVAAAVRQLGWHVVGILPSPILGGDGNREFLLGAEVTEPA
jgi:23S rRNA (cytidine1920-2'-O)/16S rRNA (cytidine1409-2'-O)-methyltransferase